MSKKTDYTIASAIVLTGQILAFIAISYVDGYVFKLLSLAVHLFMAFTALGIAVLFLNNINVQCGDYSGSDYYGGDYDER